jgi:hypothetical protein
MSGWVASRVIAESGAFAVTTDSLPLGGTAGWGAVSPRHPAASPASPSTLLRAGAGAGAGAAASSSSSASAAATTSLRPASSVVARPGSLGVTFGWPRGAGAAVGMGPVRLDLALSERLAAVRARKEETENRALMQRRYYVQSLKTYCLEAKETKVALERLRAETLQARQEVRPNRPTAFATDAEEWAAVDRMAAASAAVWAQNKELRARLAAATLRHSGNVDGEPFAGDGEGAKGAAAAAPASTTAAAADAVVLTGKNGAVVGGGAKPSKRRASPARTTPGAAAAAAAAAASSAAAAGSRRGGPDDMSDDEGGSNNGDGDGDVALGENPYRPHARRTPRRSGRAARRSGRDTVLAFGDLVLTPFGRGVVLAQRDQPAAAPREPFVDVLLAWGARAAIQSHQVSLLAVAGEEYTAPLATDWEVALGAQDAPASASSSSAAGASSVPLRARAAAGGHPSALNGPGVAGVGLHGTSTAEMDEEVEDERAAAHRVTRKVMAESGLPLSSRTPVFRTSWDRNGVPRGVPLRIDPVRGTSTLGFIVSTADGSAVFEKDQSHRSLASPHGGMAGGAHAGAGAGGADGHRGMGDSAASPLGLRGSSSSSNTSAAADALMRNLRAELERVQFQLRMQEVVTTSQRKQSTDMRNTLRSLIEKLNDERARVTQLHADLARKERDIDSLADRLIEMAAKYEPGTALAGGKIPGIRGDDDDDEDDDEDDDDDEAPGGGAGLQRGAGGAGSAADEEGDGAEGGAGGRTDDDVGRTSPEGATDGAGMDVEGSGAENSSSSSAAAAAAARRTPKGNGSGNGGASSARSASLMSPKSGGGGGGSAAGGSSAGRKPGSAGGASTGAGVAGGFRSSLIGSASAESDESDVDDEAARARRAGRIGAGVDEEEEAEEAEEDEEEDADAEVDEEDDEAGGAGAGGDEEEDDEEVDEAGDAEEAEAAALSALQRGGGSSAAEAGEGGEAGARFGRNGQRRGGRPGVASSAAASAAQVPAVTRGKRRRGADESEADDTDGGGGAPAPAVRGSRAGQGNVEDLSDVDGGGTGGTEGTDASGAEEGAPEMLQMLLAGGGAKGGAGATGARAGAGAGADGGAAARRGGRRSLGPGGAAAAAADASAGATPLSASSSATSGAGALGAGSENDVDVISTSLGDISVPRRLSAGLRRYAGKAVNVWVKMRREDGSEWRDKHLGLRRVEVTDPASLAATPSLIFPKE